MQQQPVRIFRCSVGWCFLFSAGRRDPPDPGMQKTSGCALSPCPHCALQAEEVAQFSSKRMSEIEAELKELDRSMVSLGCDHRVPVPGRCSCSGLVDGRLCTELKREGTRPAVGVICEHAGDLEKAGVAATA